MRTNFDKLDRYLIGILGRMGVLIVVAIGVLYPSSGCTGSGTTRDTLYVCNDLGIAEYMHVRESLQDTLRVNKTWAMLHATEEETVMAYAEPFADSSRIYIFAKRKNPLENDTAVMDTSIPFEWDIQFSGMNFQLGFPDSNFVLVRSWNLPLVIGEIK